jgi:prepilin-type N-terminal cleavage/methylation domain-containing protein
MPFKINNKMVPYSRLKKGHGFTLLEMVLVLFLMGLVASVGLMITENVDDQAKYDETKRRMAMMREAIVGNRYRTLNGQPDISGFVADMKRLPECVKELLQQKDCNDDDLPKWKQDASTGVWSGWRGPYLYVIPESDGKRYFRDGYGNSDTSDAQNSGWKYVVSGAKIMLTSKGFDGNTSAADDISDAQWITANDWQIDTIQVRFVNNSSGALPSSQADVKLRVFLSDVSSAVESSYTIPSGAIPAGDSVVYPFSFTPSSAVPLGVHGYVVTCDTGKLFDGNCSTAVDYPDSVRYFSAAPRNTPTLDWMIP